MIFSAMIVPHASANPPRRYLGILGSSSLVLKATVYILASNSTANVNICMTATGTTTTATTATATTATATTATATTATATTATATTATTATQEQRQSNVFSFTTHQQKLIIKTKYFQQQPEKKQNNVYHQRQLTKRPLSPFQE